jgi:hypothetical protein
MTPRYKALESMVRTFRADLDRLDSNELAVRGIYNYDAQGSDELGVREGELIELSAGPNGGENFGDGWWEGRTWSSKLDDSDNVIEQASTKEVRRVSFQVTMYVRPLFSYANLIVTYSA